MRSAGHFARVEANEPLVRGLRASSKDDLPALGRAIFHLLPAPVREFLVASPARCLILQTDEELAGIPWEIAYDGARFLGQKFLLARQIVAEPTGAALPAARPARHVLRLLLVRDDRRGEPYAERLTRQLGVIESLRLTSVPASELAGPRALKLIGEHHVVHYLDAPPPAGLIGSIAALPARPQLLVAECADQQANEAFARAACLAGLNALVSAPPGDDDELPILALVYAELVRGAPLGEATRRARTARLGPGLVLYGDPGDVLVEPAERPPQDDNRRPVTILSCDIVDSTHLLKTLGDELYSDVLERYRALCAVVVSRHGGHVEESKGDGILSLFGFPIAYEDSATRSLRAGAEILARIAELGISVRIGIATGQVAVAGNMPIGDVIHFAIRLQTNADPGTMFVSDSTRRIVRGKFDFQPVRRKLRLKGFDHPGPIYRVLSEAGPDDAYPFEAGQRLTPFVGRADELRLLEEHWAAARAGPARAVLVSGEAGIGKSRLVREFRRSLAARGQRAIACRGTPESAASAFYPLNDLLLRLLDIRRGDSAARKLDKIDKVLASSEIPGAAPLVAELLSIPLESRYPPLPASAEKRRQLTLDVLVQWIKREAAQAPICVIVEDIHWIDPSTRELVSRLVQQAGRLPLLVVITLRSEAAQGWQAGFAVHPLELKGLSLEAARAMVLGACGESKLPNEIVRQLATRADGVPLFIEESTRMAIDGIGTDGAVAADAGDAAPPRFIIPATIHDLLMARLDRLPEAKPVAQLGGTIGREFSLALIESVLAHESSPLRIDNLPARLAVLVDSGLLIEKNAPPNTTYFFKHTLVRDAAYQSLWERDRKRLHRAIAAVINEKFRDLAEGQPELLAYHYTEAGLEAEAISYWELGARRAASRSAHDEAISHLTKGLELLAHMAPAPERDRTELRFQLALAGRLIATEGYGAERVERVYTRASELCRILGDEAGALKVQLGLEGYHFMRADFEKAHEFARQAAAMVARSPDPVRRLQSQWAIGNILFHQGDGEPALQYWDTCLAEYDRKHHRPGAVQDPGVICLCYSAWLKWQLGYPDQAAERARKVVTLATELNHPFSMGEAYGFSTAVHHFRGESRIALEKAERAIEICEEGGFAVWLAHARLMHGRIVADLGDPDAGIEEMRQAYDKWTATGAVVTRPFYLALQAEGLALAGRVDDALAALELAFDIVRKYGERYHEAEVRRLMGELILQSTGLQGRNRDDEAERWFLGARDFARSRNFRGMELRSAISLAGLWSARGRGREAAQVLEPAYGWFSEGRKTGDLVRARKLLEELRRTVA